MHIVTSVEADRDLFALMDWLAERSPLAAERLAQRYFSTIRMLADFPHLGPEISGSDRMLPVRFGRDGLLVMYEIRAKDLLILRVLHGRQDR